MVSRKVRDLTPDQRRAFEAFLGVTVDEGESVSVRTFAGTVLQEAPAGEARASAYRRLQESMDKISEGLEGVPEETLDAAIDDASGLARRGAQRRSQ
jgi:hypothetical protein